MAWDSRTGRAARAGIGVTVALLVHELSADLLGNELVGPFVAGLVVFVVMFPTGDGSAV